MDRKQLVDFAKIINPILLADEQGNYALAQERLEGLMREYGKDSIFLPWFHLVWAMLSKKKLFSQREMTEPKPQNLKNYAYFFGNCTANQLTIKGVTADVTIRPYEPPNQIGLEGLYTRKEVSKEKELRIAEFNGACYVGRKTNLNIAARIGEIFVFGSHIGRIHSEIGNIQLFNQQEESAIAITLCKGYKTRIETADMLQAQKGNRIVYYPRTMTEEQLQNLALEQMLSLDLPNGRITINTEKDKVISFRS